MTYTDAKEPRLAKDKATRWIAFTSGRGKKIN